MINNLKMIDIDERKGILFIDRKIDTKKEIDR